MIIGNPIHRWCGLISLALRLAVPARLLSPQSDWIRTIIEAAGARDCNERLPKL